ncbi:MAG TPA: DUF4157 domain-containing protein [Mucilaginibacter sp.]|jgi:hypothetical protein|nr:DUF4157 domain-containing protein [Mucilaginibacter sp.]
MNLTKQHTTQQIKQVKLPDSKPVFFQPKLTINQPNDVYEREADAMADKVVPITSSAINQNTFFKPAVTAVQRKCQACEEEDKFVHRKESNGNDVQSGHELDSYIGSLNSSGQPMQESSRKFFEPRFGHDFSGVRLHTDTIAAKSAQSINALAYTSGNNIVFNAGQYSPESDSGMKLMAHELTHVVQQQGSDSLKNIQRVPAGNTAKPPVTSEVNKPTTETISNAPASASDWNKTFNWDAKFQVVYNLNSKRVTIVSRLYSTASDAIKTGWKNAIESKWGKGQFNLEVWEGCEPKVFPIDVDIQWVNDPAKAHYTITPNAPGATQNGRAGVGGTTGMTGWGTADATDVPHEYGHMLGNAEEYFTTNGVDYSYGGTRSGFRDRGAGIMNNPSESPFPRHYELVRTGFANMMPYNLSRVRVVQNGTYNPPLLNCGDGPKNQNVIV